MRGREEGGETSESDASSGDRAMVVEGAAEMGQWRKRQDEEKEKNGMERVAEAVMGEQG